MDYTWLRIREVAGGLSPNTAMAKTKRKISADLLRLRAALRDHLTANSTALEGDPETVRIATWNLRDFGKRKGGHRLNEAIFFIAEIISHFDIVALQEIYRDTTPFRRLMRVLGRDWDYVMTDASTSARGNDERMVFLFNKNKVFSRRVAGEISLGGDDRLVLPDSVLLGGEGGVSLSLPQGSSIPAPQDKDVKVTVNTKGTKLKKDVVLPLPQGTQVTLPAGSELVFSGYAEDITADHKIDLKNGKNRQFGAGAAVRIPPDELEFEEFNFARSPYMVQLQSRWLRLSLCTVHIYYGDDNEKGLKMLRRREEIRALTAAMNKKASDENDNDADSFLILLGDFNIKGKDHGTMEALEDNNFKVPPKIREIPKGSNVKRDKFYDQIAFWEGKNRRRQFFRDYTSIEVAGAGVFDFFEHVFRDGDADPDGIDEDWYLERRSKVAPDKTSSYGNWRTYQMSDHLPMWIELRADFSDAYLENACKAGGHQ